MKYTVVKNKRFKTSYKKIVQSPRFKEAVFIEVVTLLANGERLPARFKDHQLTGSLKAFRECHLAPDILLMYKQEDTILTLVLVDTGTHAKLFKR